VDGWGQMSEKQMSGHDDSVVLCPIRYLHKMSILRDFVTLTRIRPISLEQVLTRAFHFAIGIDSIRFVMRIDSMQFFLVYLLYSLSRKIS